MDTISLPLAVRGSVPQCRPAEASKKWPLLWHVHRLVCLHSQIINTLNSRHSGLKHEEDSWLRGWFHICSSSQRQCIFSGLSCTIPQVVGGTLIGEDGLMVMTGGELVEWYQINQPHVFHAFWCHSLRSKHYYELSSPPAVSIVSHHV